MPSNRLVLSRPLLLLLLSFPASGPFPRSQLFASELKNEELSFTECLPRARL